MKSAQENIRNAMEIKDSLRIVGITLIKRQMTNRFDIPQFVLLQIVLVFIAHDIWQVKSI